MKSWWKNPRLIGALAYWAMRVLSLTLRVKIIESKDYDPKVTYLFAFWHGMQFLPAIALRKQHKTPMTAMVSPSRDGAMLATFLSKLGYFIIRGSARDKAVKALLSLKKNLERGLSVGFGIDGPIGPIHVVKPGIIFLTQKTGKYIVPIGVAYSSYWQFHKAWDKFKLPKPFAKACLVFGTPISFDSTVDIKEACTQLQNTLHEVEQSASAQL